jgi:2-C-methyl-D-erythritol 4-phosphate cytidylyltransferase
MSQPYRSIAGKPLLARTLEAIAAALSIRGIAFVVARETDAPPHSRRPPGSA